MVDNAKPKGRWNSKSKLVELKIDGGTGRRNRWRHRDNGRHTISSIRFCVRNGLEGIPMEWTAEFCFIYQSNMLEGLKASESPMRLIIAMDSVFWMEYLHSKNIVGDFGLSKLKRNTFARATEWWQ